MEQTAWFIQRLSQLLDRPPNVGQKRQMQHLVSAFYLRHFEVDGKIAIFDRETQASRRQSSKKVARQDHFYTLNRKGDRNIYIEEAFGLLETVGPELIKKLATREELTEEERHNMTFLMALTAVRTEDAIEKLKDFYASPFFALVHGFSTQDQAEEFIRRMMPACPPTAAPAFAAAFVRPGVMPIKRDDNLHETAVLHSFVFGMDISEHIWNRKWTVVHVRKDCPGFITSDVPFVIGRKNDMRKRVRVDLRADDTWCFFPLTPLSAIVVHGNHAHIAHTEVDDKFVQGFNEAIASRCRRFICGQSAEQLQELAKGVFESLSAAAWARNRMLRK